jgi:hypothetical protein
LAGDGEIVEFETEFDDTDSIGCVTSFDDPTT